MSNSPLFVNYTISLYCLSLNGARQGRWTSEGLHWIRSLCKRENGTTVLESSVVGARSVKQTVGSKQKVSTNQ